MVPQSHGIQILDDELGVDSHGLYFVDKELASEWDSNFAESLAVGAHGAMIDVLCGVHVRHVAAFLADEHAIVVAGLYEALLQELECTVRP